MPYKNRQELPKQVKDSLPKHAEEICRKAYNSTHEQYKKPTDRKGGSSREETASKVAWAAVKKEYKKSGDDWVKK